MKNGFTIIELMMTILIISIVLAMAVPSFTVTIQNNRMASQTNTLLGTLNYARSEAVKLGTTVTICGSSSLTNCTNTANWESGWIIFRDNNSNGAVDSGETILRVQEALSGGNTLRVAGFSSATNIKFGDRGMLTSSGSLRLCDSRGATSARGIVLNISGQARSAIDEDGDDTINLHTGANATCP